MKTFSFLILFSAALFGHSQIVPNGGFENWANDTLFNTPEPFNTGNQMMVLLGMSPTVLRSTDAHGGMYSAHIQNSFDFPGWIALGTPSPGIIDNPIQHSGQPDSLTFWCQYDMVPGDSAIVFLSLMQDGVEVGIGYRSIGGTSPAYEYFSVPVYYLSNDPPNQLGLVIFGSNTDSPNAYSELYVDDLHLVYNEGDGDDIPGGDFELWNSRVDEHPVGWMTTNGYNQFEYSVSRDEDAYEGNYCALIETQPLFFDENTSFGFVYLGSITGEPCDPASWQLDPATTVIESISGHYKFNPAIGQDSASIYMYFSKYNEGLGACDSLLEYAGGLAAASEWTPFTFDIPPTILADWIANGAPEFLTLAFTSAYIEVLQDNLNGPLGSQLWVDGLTASNFIVGVNESSEHTVHIFPNPAGSYLRVNLPSTTTVAQVSIFDMTGREVLAFPAANIRENIELGSIESGQYVIRVISDGGAWTSSFIKQ